MIKKNVKMTEIPRYSAWRKISLGSWKVIGDSQVYCDMNLSVKEVLPYLEKLNKENNSKITITHFLGKVMGKVLQEIPELNRVVTRNRIFQREDSDIFFHIAYEKTELSGHVIRGIDNKNLDEIEGELRVNAKKVREDKDESFKKIKRTWDFIPNSLVKVVLNLLGFISYGLNINIKALNVPQDAFGSMMITNIGSLGFEQAFVPLPGYTHVPIIFALGKIQWKPVCNDKGVVYSDQRVSVCVTFDHRIIDGARGAKVYERLKYYFNNPEAI